MYHRAEERAIVTYEIWGTVSRNLIAGFRTKAEALEAVREALRRHGEGYVETWLLAYEDENEDSSTVAAGIALLKLARSAAA